MAFDPTDFLTIVLNSPQYAFAILLLVSGYVLFSVFYRGSSHWHRFSTTEKWLIGGVLGGYCGFTILPLVDTMLYVGYHIHVDLLSLAWISSGLVTVFALAFWVFDSSGIPKTSLMRNLKDYMVSVSVLSTCLLIAVSTIEFEISLYPDSVWPLVEGYCSGFNQLTLFVPIIWGLPLYILFLRPRLVEHSQGIPTLRYPGSRTARRSILRLMRTIVNVRVVRYALALFLVVLVVSSIVVPIDKELNLFTPRVVTGHESFYAAEACPIDAYSHLLMIRTSDGAYKFYQKMQLTYNLTLPSLKRILAFVSVQNPSNFSAYVRPLDMYYDAWMYLQPSSASEISFSYTRANGKVTAIVANLTAVADATAQFSVSYYNEFLERGVKVSEFENSTSIDNTTTLETNTFLVTNGDEFCLTIPRMELVKLTYEGVNGSLSKVYFNGQLLSPVEVSGPLVYPWVTVSPGTTANIKITFPRKSIQRGFLSLRVRPHGCTAE